MKRRMEPIDLVVAIGVFATVVSGYFMFMTANGMVQTQSAGQFIAEPTPTVADAMDWIQPALGQAIVDQAILDRTMAGELMKEVRELNQVSMADQQLRAMPFGFMDRVRAYAAVVEGDHSARVQEVMGRAIVRDTSRGVRTGGVTVQNLNSPFNQTLISRALLMGGQIDESFRIGWQESLGRMIVASSQDYLEIAGSSQERLGRSILGVLETQDVYRQKQAAVQVQLASAAVAAIHGEQIADRFAHLAAADAGMSSTASTPMQPSSLPEVPAGVLGVASVGLVGMFVAGMVMARTRPSRGVEKRAYEVAEERYRRTA